VISLSDNLVGSHVRFLTVLLVEEEIREGGNGGVFPKVGKICVGGKSSNEMDIAFIRFTLIDEPDPPLA